MRRLALLAAVVGLLAWAAAPALSSRPDGLRASDFEQALGTPPVTAVAAGGHWQSGVVRAPRRFDLFGLRWRGPGRADAEVRVRRDGGGWSRWTPAGEGHGVRYGTDPVWTGGADEYQIRMSRRVSGLRAHFVRTSGTAPLGLRRMQAANTGLPAIIPRSAWGASQCPPRVKPSYGHVDVAFVHHTVSTNDYTPEQSAAMVLAICRYHRNSNGWNDVGYNFLVDRYGQIFEGRAGGVDRAVIGAQAQGFNTASTGVAALGTHTNVPLSAEALQSISRLLAWKLSLTATPALGAVTLRSGGGSLNRFGSGTDVVLQRISGHRDVGKTECPGDLLYAQLAEIRRQTAELATTFTGPVVGALSIVAADRTLDYPQSAALGGVLKDSVGLPLSGISVNVQIRGKAGWTTLVSASTDSSGTWAADLPVTQNRTVRAIAFIPGGQATSRTLHVQVAPHIELRAPARVVVKRLLRVTGTISPAAAPLRLDVARPGADGRFHTVAKLPVKLRGRTFSAGVRLQRPALTRLQVVFAGDDRSARARSAPITVRAVRKASATGGAGAG